MRAVLACAAMLVAGGFGGGTPELSTARVRDSVLGIVRGTYADQTMLAWIDPLTLRPLPGRVGLGYFSSFPTFSPDGRQIAFADMYGKAWIRLVDLDRQRVAWKADVGDRLYDLAWLRSGSLVAVVGAHQPADLEVKLLDPERGRVAAGGRIAGPVWAQQSVASDRYLVLLLWRPAPRVLPPTELAIVDARGGVRHVVLAKIRTGVVADAGIPRRAQAGLAIDKRRQRAFVVAAGAPVAEVDLATGAVWYHELHHRSSQRGPAGIAKGPIEGPIRHAIALANGLIAVTGDNHFILRRTGGGATERILPAGLQLIDPDDWSVRTIDERSSSVEVADHVMLAWTFPMIYVPPELRRIGVTAYTLDGKRRFRLFSGRGVSSLVVAGRYAYAGIGGDSGIQVVELETGRVIRRLGDRPWLQLLVPTP
jgi:hypothetical protein